MRSLHRLFEIVADGVEFEHRLAAIELRLHARGQHPQIDRLGDVVVGAGLERGGDDVAVIQRGDDDNRHVLGVEAARECLCSASWPERSGIIQSSSTSSILRFEIASSMPTALSRSTTS